MITTIVLAVGFSILMFSGITLNSSLGIMTGVILTAAFLLDVLLLPALLLVFDRDPAKATKTAETADTQAEEPLPVR